MPVNGFGKIWNEHPDVRERVGCPTELEAAIQAAAQERFQYGYMFWREDTKIIYVFKFNSPTDAVGTWLQYDDTWQEGEPLPTPSATPPAGLYAPQRGFGKLWYNNKKLQNDVGWAVEPEQAAKGAWQSYEHGYALWTDDKVIRFMFRDNANGGSGSNGSSGIENIWMLFNDAYVFPTPSPTPR